MNKYICFISIFFIFGCNPSKKSLIGSWSGKLGHNYSINHTFHKDGIVKIQSSSSNKEITRNGLAKYIISDEGLVISSFKSLLKNGETKEVKIPDKVIKFTFLDKNTLKLNDNGVVILLKRL